MMSIMNEIIKIIEGYNREKEQINDYFGKLSGSMYEVDKLKVEFFKKRLGEVDSKLDFLSKAILTAPTPLTDNETK